MWKGNIMQGSSGPAAAADQSQQLRQLQEQLAAREQEVAALREIAEAAAELQSQDVQSAKVIELSKKNRALNLSLEKERNKVAKLQQALSQAHTEAQQAASSTASKPPAAADEHLQELTTLRERVQQMTNRMGQMEQKVFLLEGENKKLTRALVREVGEGTSLQKVLEEGSGTDWRGRREQIIRLQDTVRQLREAAAAAAARPVGADGQPAASTANSSSSGLSGSLAKHEAAHRTQISKANKQKDSELQRMAAELAAAKAATEQLRLKFTGASSRRKVLEEEVAGLKDKLSVVLAKTANDDKLIAALRKELVAATGGKAGAGRSLGASGDAAAGGGSFEVSQARCSELEEQVEQQQKVIRYLQAQLDGTKQDPQQQRALQEEATRLRQQLAVLQLSAGSGGGGASALQQQVLLLQEENMQIRTQLKLTRSDFEVLEAAKEALIGGEDDMQEQLCVDEGEEEEEEEGLGRGDGEEDGDEGVEDESGEE